MRNAAEKNNLTSAKNMKGVSINISLYWRCSIDVSKEGEEQHCSKTKILDYTSLLDHRFNFQPGLLRTGGRRWGIIKKVMQQGFKSGKCHESIGDGMKSGDGNMSLLLFTVRGLLCHV